MSDFDVDSSIGSTMVKNVELAKKVQEWDEENLELKATIESLESMLEETTLKIEAVTSKVTQQEECGRKK